MENFLKTVDTFSGPLSALVNKAVGYGVVALFASGAVDVTTVTPESVVGAIMLILTVGWSMFTRRQAAKIHSVNAEANGVKVVDEHVPAPTATMPLPNGNTTTKS